MIDDELIWYMVYRIYSIWQTYMDNFVAGIGCHDIFERGVTTLFSVMDDDHILYVIYCILYIVYHIQYTL